MRRILTCLAALLVTALWASGYPLSSATAGAVTWVALSPERDANVPTTAPRNAANADPVEEMLRGSKGRREQWATAPQLVVLRSVLQFQPGGSSEYSATADVLSDDDVDGLVRELTNALALLTGDTFPEFAGVQRESVAPGAVTQVMRRNQIVVARFRGVRQHAGVLGLGGRSVRGDGAITAAALILDDEYDHGGPMRTLLRTHELGHALGYNHVQSRESIMNPRIGPDATELDRRIAAIAYQASGPVRPSLGLAQFPPQPD